MDAAKWHQLKENFSLASSLFGDERQTYIAGLEPGIRLELENLLAAANEAGDFINEPYLLEQGVVRSETNEVSNYPQIDDYILIEPIGSGGMGTVYLAEHRGEGFTHNVALKLIKRGMDSTAVLRRFLTERRILANLDHPNIARMLDGGSTPDGLPYFVMEYVRGQPIRSYCDAAGLDPRSRLKIFAKVCSAVTYAHQKLVVHRDLKPSNILVTADAEPKLLDFGIAKLLQPDFDTAETATATNFRILTPEYASPEQIRGEATSTLTDVYSLGVVLYELLTGVRPFQAEGRSPIALAEAMSTKDPRKPSVAAASASDELTRGDDKSTVAEIIHSTGESRTKSPISRTVADPRDLRGDIDNIVMKAIRREPDRRYQSVQEFLDDIERYLKGLPVKATADTLTYRARKFVRRHKAAVTAAALAGVVLAGTAGIAAYQYREASRERVKAEARFNEGRRYANTILFDHYERIKDLPGSTEAKAKLVAEAVSYLDAVSKDSGGDPGFQREMVKAYLKLAEIQGMTNGTGDLGDQAAASESVQKGLAIQEQLVAANPTNVQDQRQLAQLLSSVGVIPDLTFEQKQQYAARSFQIYGMLRQLNPDKEQAESDYARGLWDQANATRKTGNSAGAIEKFTEAAAIYEALYNSGAGNKRFRRSASLTYKSLGTVYRLTGDTASALSCYEKALAFDRQIYLENPDSIEARLGLSFSHRGVGEALTVLNQLDRAISEFREAAAIQELVLSSDPKNAFAADNLADTYCGLAVAFREESDFSNAELYFRKSLDLSKNTPRSESDSLRLLYTAKSHTEYGEMLVKRRSGRDHEKAKAEFDLAIETFEKEKARGFLDPAMIEPYERAKKHLSTL